jgi:hypothetical protein
MAGIVDGNSPTATHHWRQSRALIVVESERPTVALAAHFRPLALEPGRDQRVIEPVEECMRPPQARPSAGVSLPAPAAGA